MLMKTPMKNTISQIKDKVESWLNRIRLPLVALATLSVMSCNDTAKVHTASKENKEKIQEIAEHIHELDYGTYETNWFEVKIVNVGGEYVINKQIYAKDKSFMTNKLYILNTSTWEIGGFEETYHVKIVKNKHWEDMLTPIENEEHKIINPNDSTIINAINEIISE